MRFWIAPTGGRSGCWLCSTLAVGFGTWLALPLAGVGVVVFSLLLETLASGSIPAAGEGLRLLLREAGGGLLFGAVLGYPTFRLLRASTATRSRCC